MLVLHNQTCANRSQLAVVLASKRGLEVSHTSTQHVMYIIQFIHLARFEVFVTQTSGVAFVQLVLRMLVTCHP